MTKVDLKKRFLKEFQKLPKKVQGQDLFLAVSGGMDSTALAHTALSLSKQLPPLHFVHVNYHLRIPDSDREEEFLAHWASAEGLLFHVKRFYPKRKPNNLQDWARQGRYNFFKEIIQKKYSGKGLLCLAHHRMDQVETLLCRIITGAGLKALGGMKTFEAQEDGLVIFRPFLAVPKGAIETYVASQKLSFCQDRSNEEMDYFRNRLRHQVLPLLVQENPRVEEALVGMGTKARLAQEDIEERAGRWLARHGGKGKGLVEISRAAFEKLSPALRGAVAELWLRSVNSNTRNLGKTLKALEMALAKPRSSHSIILKEKLELKVSVENIRIQRRKSPFRKKKRPGKPL